MSYAELADQYRNERDELKAQLDDARAKLALAAEYEAATEELMRELKTLADRTAQALATKE